MRLLFTIDSGDYDPKGRPAFRPSARAVIVRGGLVAMVHSEKYDYYKFPGGGINAGESRENALIRETMEETGLAVVPESVKEYGYVHRVRKSLYPDADYFVQDNYYYFCDVAGEARAQRLDDYEAEERFTLAWVKPEAAMIVNARECGDARRQEMMSRENGVLKMLMDEEYFSAFALKELDKAHLARFKRDMQEAFQKGAEDEFGAMEEEILPESHIDRSLAAPGAVAYEALVNGVPAGGAIVVIDEKTQHNHLDFLFVKVGAQSRGVGQKIWREIERLHPETKVWETCTPYFERRNIHFYINRCGFHVVEFFNRFHPDPDDPDGAGEAPEDEVFSGMFRFEKDMRREQSSGGKI